VRDEDVPRGPPRLSPADSWRDDTYEQRSERLVRRTRLVSTVGIALGGFVVVLAAGDSAASMYGEVPRWARAVVFTLIVLAGAFLGAAYIRYEEAGHLISVEMKRGLAKPDDPIGETWPDRADHLWYIALVFTTLTPVAFIATAWWAAAR
jgi:hypothetical protein